MDNQHKLIRGYRELSQEEINLMNKVKATGEQLGDLIDELRSIDSTDKRWLAIGNTDLQTGIMALVRSIAKPTTF